MATSKLSRVLNTMANIWKTLEFSVSEIPDGIFSNMF